MNKVPDPIDDTSSGNTVKADDDMNMIYEYQAGLSDKAEKPKFPPNEEIKDFTMTPKKEFNIPLWIIMVLFALVMAGGYYYHTYTLKKHVVAYRSVYSSLQQLVNAGSAKAVSLEEENTALKDRINELAASKVVEQVVLNVEDQAIADWAYKNSVPFVPKSMVEDIIREASRYDNYLLLVSIMKTESNFHIFASSGNKKGLGQIDVQVWKEELIAAGIWEEEIDVFDYKKHLAAVNYILEVAYKVTGDWRQALVKYNSKEAYDSKVLGTFAELSLILGRVKK